MDLGLSSNDLLTFMAKRDGYSTLMLKWCTPAAAKSGNYDQTAPTNSAHRATPVEVNSRPSACLTSFVLSGKFFLSNSNFFFIKYKF